EENQFEFYGAPDSLITPDHSFLQIANFNKQEIQIQPGQILGWAHIPENWLDTRGSLPRPTWERLEKHSAAVKAVAKDLLNRDQVDSKNLGGEGQDELQGGPKTAETADPDPIPMGKLLDEIHFSTDLTTEQRNEIAKIVLKHPKAFGLDGRLGHYNCQVKVPLKEGSKPISLPPFGSSPEKRQII
ncbi:hypothetical protein SCHPADRAFT_815443, partial [Schizopora paradoxa]